MPHVIIKLQVGRSAQQKTHLAEMVAKAVMAGANCTEEAVSVSVEDVEKDRWVEAVYRPDILGKPDQVFKKPGYDPL
jgi:4-oxalocrotonate tautomerase